MRLIIALLMILVFSATADLDIWTAEEVASLIPLGNNLDLQLTVYHHLPSLTYYPAELILVKTPTTIIPDSFSVYEGLLVSPLDHSKALEVEGFYQILSENRAIAEIDKSRSSLPDSLVINYLWEPFGSEPETTTTHWILIDESYVNSENPILPY